MSRHLAHSIVAHRLASEATTHALCGRDKLLLAATATSLSRYLLSPDCVVEYGLGVAFDAAPWWSEQRPYLLLAAA